MIEFEKQKRKKNHLYKFEEIHSFSVQILVHSFAYYTLIDFRAKRGEIRKDTGIVFKKSSVLYYIKCDCVGNSMICWSLQYIMGTLLVC